ncbi:MAG: redoxin family protein [Pseudomonadota bacterium]|nr:redoxin family protein [Pseudomonadota bacterium]
MNATTDAAMPEWDIAQWFNTEKPLRLADLRGQVVLIHAFQMLCPGCVIHAIPQARKVHELYGGQGVAVIGLHTVFEHHDAMQPHALQALIHKYGLRVPVGVDAPSAAGEPVPRTMARLGLCGTPTTLVLDRRGRLRVNHFGHVDDLPLGTVLGHLLAEAAPESE